MAAKESDEKAPIPNLSYILCEDGWNEELPLDNGVSDNRLPRTCPCG